MTRRNYEESIDHLIATSGMIDPCRRPTKPPRIPRYDDDSPLGLSFFKMFVTEVDFSNLTIPRTYFGRAEINDCSFKDCALWESSMCWCEFENVDFSKAELMRSDMRSSIFTRCDFRAALLVDSDLRHSIFLECSFDDAQMTNAKLTRVPWWLLRHPRIRLTDEQKNVVRWFGRNEGDIPLGG